MKEAALRVDDEPKLRVEAGDPGTLQVFGPSIVLGPILLQAPPVEPVRRPRRAIEKAMNPEVFGSMKIYTGPDAEKLATYQQARARYQALAFRVTNVGRILTNDVRVVLEVPDRDTLQLTDELPRRPRGTYSIAELRGIPSVPSRYWTEVTRTSSGWRVEARLAKVQPAAAVWSEPFWIGSDVPVSLELSARVYGDNLPVAIDVPLTLTLTPRSLPRDEWTDPEGADDGA